MAELPTVPPIRPNDRFQGFQEELPFRKADRVRVRKGARLRSMNPRRKGRHAALRSQTIVVHHTLPGRTIRIGIVEVEDGEERFFFEKKLKDVFSFAEKLGLEGARRDEERTLKFLVKYCVRVERSPTEFELLLPVENAAIVWSGSGSYWVECDVNDVVMVEKARG